MSRPFLSIVTVTKNCLEALRVTMASVQEQMAADFEYIIQDGGSTDGTKELALNRPAPVTSAFSEPDSGIYDAMNRAVTHCTGTYVQFLNAGDTYVSPTSLSEARPFLAAEPDIAAFGYRIDGACYVPDLSFGGLIGGMPCHQGILYKRSLLQQRPFDQRFRFCADYHHLLDALFSCDVITSSLTLVNYDTGGVSSSKSAQRRISLERYRGALAASIPLRWKIPLTAYNLARAGK